MHAKKWKLNRNITKIKINNNSNLHPSPKQCNVKIQKFLVCLYFCVCECLLQNNIHVSEVHCGSALRFGQALPGYFITAHHLYASLR